MNPTVKKGYVIIAGAGPGDEELITLKLQKALQRADVIIADRLVNPAIINAHAQPGALHILAGKQGFNKASISQDEINQMLITYAQQGNLVLRLKGGDVAFYSNVYDELQVLKAAHIPYEIIPGITAASGASACAGIPLTARGISQGVQLLSLHPNSRISPEKWKRLAASGDTLVFYMSASNLAELAEMMLRYSRRPQTPLAVVEQASTLHQRVHLSTLQDCTEDFAGISFSSPSLVIIGEVARLHNEFKWLPETSGIGSPFKELIHQ